MTLNTSEGLKWIVIVLKTHVMYDIKIVRFKVKERGRAFILILVFPEQISIHRDKCYNDIIMRHWAEERSGERGAQGLCDCVVT